MVSGVALPGLNSMEAGVVSLGALLGVESPSPMSSGPAEIRLQRVLGTAMCRVAHRTYAGTAVVVAGCLTRRIIGRCPDVVEKLLHPELGIFFLGFFWRISGKYCKYQKMPHGMA